jgi:hypothetical protein
MNSQKLSSAKTLFKRWVQLGLLLLTASFAACAGPSEPESSPQSANINLSFPYLAKEVKTLEYRLEPNSTTTIKGSDLTRVGQINIDPTTSPKLELTDLTTGSYQITVKAKDATDGIVLYKTSRAVQAQPAPKTNSSTKQATPQTIVLGRATGVVDLSTIAPTDGTTLNYIAQLGANKINLRLENNQLLGRFNAVPTGRNLEVLVEGRDRAGTLLYQGGKRFDLPDSLVTQSLELVQVTAERVPPVISTIRVPTQVAPGEKFQLELELKASQNLSTATLTDLLVNWGDGISEIPTVTGATATLKLEHAFTEVNAQVITVTAINNFGLRAQETRDVAVTDPTGVRPESPLSLVYLVVRDVPLNVDSLEAKISPIAATAGSRAVEPERTIRLTKDTPNIWGGSVQLLKGSSYNTNLTAKVVTLNQVLQSSSNGTYAVIAPQKDSETVEFQFVAPIILNPGEDPNVTRVDMTLNLTQVPLTAAALEAVLTKTSKTGETSVRKYAMNPASPESWVIHLPDTLEKDGSKYSVNYRMTSGAGVTVVGPQVLSLEAARSRQALPVGTILVAEGPEVKFTTLPVQESPTPPDPPPANTAEYLHLGQFDGDGGTCETLRLPEPSDTVIVSTVRDFDADVVYSGYQWRNGDGAQLKLFKDESSNTFYFVIAGSVPTFFQGNINDANENLFSQSPFVAHFSSYTEMVKRALIDAAPLMQGGKLVVTGHSQGGNIAALLYIGYLAHSDQEWINTLDKYNVTMIGGFAVASRPKKELDNINSTGVGNSYVQLITDNDVVPELSSEAIEISLKKLKDGWPAALLDPFGEYLLQKNVLERNLGQSAYSLARLGLPWLPRVDFTNAQQRVQMHFDDVTKRAPYIVHGSAYIDRRNVGKNELHSQPDTIFLRGTPSAATSYEFRVLENDWGLDANGQVTTVHTLSSFGPAYFVQGIQHMGKYNSGTLQSNSDGTSLIYKPNATFWRNHPSGIEGQYEDVWQYNVFDRISAKVQLQAIRIKIIPSTLEVPTVLYPDFSAPSGRIVFPANAPIRPYLPGLNSSGNGSLTAPVTLKHVRGWGADCRTHPIIPKGKEVITLNDGLFPVDVCLPANRSIVLKYASKLEDQGFIERKPDGVPDTLWVDSVGWGERTVDNKKPMPDRSVLESSIRDWSTDNPDPFDENKATFSRNLVSCERGRDPGDSPKITAFNVAKAAFKGALKVATNPLPMLMTFKDFVTGSNGQRREIINNVKQGVARSVGDPHINTIDGITYTTMSLGEFVYARSNVPSGLELQVRHARLSNFADWGSFNVAAAIKADGKTFEVRLPPSREATENLILLVDGKPLKLPPGVYTLGETTFEIQADNSLVVYVLEQNIPSGFMNSPEAWTRVRIGKKPENDLVRADTSEPVVSLDIEMATLSIGRYQGLMGTPNGVIQDEMTIPNGNVETSLSRFIEAWRNTDRTKSLFTYEAGQGPETFNLIQDKLRPSPADLTGANGGTNQIAVITALINDTCKENSQAVDPTFIEQEALELALGRTTKNLIASGFCSDNHILNAGRPAPEIATTKLSGQVTLEDLAVGASGASVVVTSPTLGLKLCETTTTNEGRYSCGYTFERPANSSTLQLIYRIRGRGTTIERDVSVPMPVVGAVGSVEQNFVAKVTNTLHLRGRVLDPAGAVVPNALMRIVLPYREFQADANGAYDLYEPVPDGVTSGSIRLEATDPAITGFIGRDLSFQATQAGAIDLTQDLQLQANVQLPVYPIEIIKNRYLTVAGRVLSALDLGQGLSGAQVVIRAPGSVKSDGCTTTTDETGNYACRFELTTDQPFNAEVQVSGIGSAAPITINIAADELPAPGGSSNKTVADIAAKTTVLQVTGIVRGQGNVIVGADVYASIAGYGTTIKTDATGRYTARFTISDVIPPTAKLEVKASFTTPAGTSNASVSVDVGTITSGGVNERTQDLEFVTRNLLFTGFVKNGFASGQTVLGARILIERNGVSICNTSTYYSGSTPGQYGCAYSVTSPDPFQVTYVVSEHGSLRLENVTVDPSVAPVNGQTPIQRDLEVRPNTLHLSGTVTKTGGAIVPNAKLELIDGLKANFLADAQGKYSIFFDFPDTQTVVNFDLRALDGANIVTKTLAVTLTASANALTERTENLEVVTSNSGTLKWTYLDTNPDGGLDSSRTSVVGPDGTIYMIRYDNVTNKFLLFAVAPDGTQRWTYNEPTEDFYSTRMRMGSDGTIYVTSGNPSALNLYAINPNGTRKYLFQTADPIRSDPYPGANGVVYMIFGSKLYKIGASGSSVWSVTINTTNFENGGIKELADGSVVVVTARGYTSGTGSLVVVNADGTVRRNTVLSLGFDRVERVETDGTVFAYRVYRYESDAPEFAVFNPDGTVRWSRSGSGGDSSYAIAANGTTYLRVNSDLIALDSTGNQLWTTPIAIGQVALLPDGTLIVTTSSEVKAIATDGTLKWTYALSGSPNSLKIGGDSSIYVGVTTGTYPNTQNNRVVTLNPDGSPKWQFTDPDASSLSAILEFGNIIYFNSNKKLFALNR